MLSKLECDFNKNEITEIELELTGYCNLKCPRCSNNYVHSQHMRGKNIRSLNEIENQLDEYPFLKTLMLAGQVSEPTLYPYFISFLKYLKLRNIKVELYTNASVLNQKLFSDIGKTLNLNDKVIFTVCGTTQELHSRYRVNSKLENVLLNARALRKNLKIDYVQYIRFKYNKEDYKIFLNTIAKEFSYSFMVESEGDRLYNDGINPIVDKPLKDALIKNIFKKIKDPKLDKKLRSEIWCEWKLGKKIYIDQYGNTFRCAQIKEYNGDDECCKMCSKTVKKYMKMYNVDFLC